MKYKILITPLLFVALLQKVNAQTKYEISSPDQSLKVNVILKDKQLFYQVSRNGAEVLNTSTLGLVSTDADFSKNLSLLSVSKSETVKDTYTLKNAKRLINNYAASKRVIHLENGDKKKLDLIFQVSNDGIAFRYYFPDRDTKTSKLSAEKTSFHFFKSSKAWMQPMSVAKTGWESTNPSYEEYYKKEINVGTPAPTDAGWVYPALFNYKDTWLLVSETGLDGNYCATRLKQNSPDGNYEVGFPDQREAFTGQNVNPESTLPWYTPWRIIAIGSLKTVTESTLGTDLAYPAKSNINPDQFQLGKASWSWIILKDNSIKYDVQKKYIDFAADMKWEFCLIDVNWDTTIGFPKMQELADYAKSKNVGLILWYNSAGAWNTVKYTPKNKLNVRESRLQEFAMLQKMGIKGIKVDFFGGDGQSMIKYYLEIFEDAAKFGLSVNCHGATLPRGWQRTYPNLVTMESIKGMEFITFEQENANEEPAHATTIPFTRNVFDPMDFTPMSLNKLPNINLKTTSTFELALPILFHSGIQHLAETPEGMAKVPAFVKSFLQEFPASWTDTKLIDGYPGKFVVMARKAGNKWYIGGINGENTAKEVSFDSAKFGKKAKLIVDGKEDQSFVQSELNTDTKTNVNMKPYGGFVLVVE
ncbi:glycoside hydrolase family 97 protein [Pedobacter sp. CFBP9032]|uniref:glycoside hydrolase family 97 protein n=1 Tax=Pedobacter sp. CFBP9032 TaxID=3096539 RepID=UPI002A6A6077|nr:glycoside hydrolase family 97 catalytic domain-containing protein [Pedobacter sp. CFBP9032]MDY0907791.1 glycoside hydrolase family 97 catalytic domain-containing protein [Pedobacter sp. CFBP9032]